MAPLRILLANYGQDDNNSANHIAGFARGLAACGHEVRVAMVKSVPDGEFVKRDGHLTASHRTMLRLGPRFKNDQPADVFHAWTPRENMRIFAGSFLEKWGARRLLVHLEDNEEAVFRRFTGISLNEALGLDRDWPKGLVHPARYRRFLASAAGITLVHRCLEPLVVGHGLSREIAPAIDFEFFSSAVPLKSLRHELGVGDSVKVIVYNGNDHAAASADIRMLYDAVEMLLDEGRDVALLRTGHVLPGNYEGLQFRPGPRCLELGFVERVRVPQIVQMADVVVQPGNADAFNSFRLPAKVPEYLSMGKPLIMGETNIGLELAQEQCALVLPGMTTRTLAQAMAWLLDHPDEAAAMGARGSEFARRRFAEAPNVAALEAFYGKCLALSSLPSAPWRDADGFTI